MGCCSHDTCKKRSNFNVVGSKKAVYCKAHARDGMVNVNASHCRHHSCNKQPSYNVESSKAVAYCRQHAEAGMVRVRRNYCLHDSCSSMPCFNVKGSKTGLYCKKHAEADMVDVVSRRCSGDSCTKRPAFNVEGSKPALYCKKHAEDGLVNVRTRLCSYDSCGELSAFNIEGSKTALYCKQHAAGGMVRANNNRRCSQVACTRAPRWGLLADGSATVCARHKSDLLGRQFFNFSALCKVVGCYKRRRCVLDGKLSIHCRDHDPLKGGLVSTASQADDHSPSYRVKMGPSFHVKPECLF